MKLIAFIAAILAFQPPTSDDHGAPEMPIFDDVRKDIVQPRVVAWINSADGPPMIQLEPIPGATGYQAWYSTITPGPDGIPDTADDVWGPWVFVTSQNPIVPLPGADRGSWQIGVQAILPGRDPWVPSPSEGTPVYVPSNP